MGMGAQVGLHDKGVRLALSSIYMIWLRIALLDGSRNMLAGKQNIALLSAVGLGLVAGYLDIAWIMRLAGVVSEVFLRFLQLVSLPLLFFAVVSAITQMEHFEQVKTLGAKFLKYTLLTTLIAALTALGFYTLFNPTVDAVASQQAISPAALEHSYFEFLWSIVPDNFVRVFLDNQVLGCASIGVILGLSVLRLGAGHKQVVTSFFAHGFALVLQAAKLVIALIPLGIWAFVAQLVQEFRAGNEALSLILTYVLCVVSANLVQGFIVLPALLKFKGISPVKAFKGMWPALSLAFLSKSSSATMPMTLECIQKLHVKPRIAKSGVPLCTVFNMNGCAAFILVTVLFVTSYHGLHFSAGEQLIWVGIATLAAIGNAGVPMGCYFLTSAILVGLGIPLTLMGLILPIYTIIDMIETTVNVWSDSCICLIVDKETI